MGKEKIRAAETVCARSFVLHAKDAQAAAERCPGGRGQRRGSRREHRGDVAPSSAALMKVSCSCAPLWLGFATPRCPPPG